MICSSSDRSGEDLFEDTNLDSISMVGQVHFTMFIQLRVEDRLHGAQTFPTWKERITRILDTSDAEEHIDCTKVAPTDPTYLATWNKIDSRAMLIIMDGVKDHIVPHLSGKKTTLEMRKDLESLYQRKSEN